MMLTKNKKKQLSYLSRILVLPLAFLVFTAFTLTLKKDAPIAEAVVKDKIVVVIDAGHGGTDYGAKAQDGTTEHDLLVQIIEKIKTTNQDKNIEIKFTGVSENSYALRDRVQLAKNADADIFISLHLNSQPSRVKPKSGIEVLIAQNGNEHLGQSKLLASAAIQTFKSNSNLTVADAPFQRATKTWVLDEAVCPAILLECGYMNNAKDLAFLKSDAGQKQIAENVLKTITLYAGSRSNDVDAYRKNVEDTPKITIAIDNSTTTISIKNEDGKQTNSSLEVLYVVDGKKTTKAEMEKIDPSNIKSVQVLKSPEQIKEYGEEGKNGVVLISTKETSNPIKNLGKVDIQMQSEADYDIFTKTEHHAEYPGGEAAWRKYLQENIQARIPSDEGWAAGTHLIKIKFIVARDGSLSDFTALTYAESLTAKHCIELIKNSGKWKPASQGGRNVNSYHIQPITVQINDM